MSTSRVILVVILIITIISAVVIGSRLIHKQFPSYWMNAAEKEIAAENYEDARFNLRRLLAKDPTNVDAMLLLDEVIRKGNEKAGGSDRYSANPAAVKVLARAAELRPDDLELQQRTLRAYLAIGEIGKAVPIAAEVVKGEPTDPDAHIALTWHAVEKKDVAQARKLFKQFEANEISTPRLFHTLALQHKFYVESENDEAADRVLANAAWKAQNVSDEDLGRLLATDRIYMLELLMRYQNRAEHAQESLDRGRIVIETAKRLNRLDLADKTVLANAAANSIALFNLKFPALNLEPTHRVLRDQLSLDAEELGTAGLANAAERKISAPMLVYWNTARTLMTRGEFEQALEVLNTGIRAAETMDDRSKAGLLDLHLLAARALISAHRYEEADAHLNELLVSARFEGWSHLLKGSVALHQGRLQLAHEEFLKAKGTMGDKILVQMSLAHTHMAREEWAAAIPLLEAIDRPVEELTDEEKAWHRQLLGGGDRIHFDLLRAKLALGRWNDAQTNLAVLKDGKLAPNAWGVVVTYLWDDEKNKTKARAYMDRVRERYPDNLALAMLDARLLKEDGRTVEAAKVVEEYAAAHNDEISQLALARWQIRNRQPEQALRTLARVEQRSGLSVKARNTVEVYRVQALIGAQQFDEADRKADDLIANKGTATAGYLMKAALAFRIRDEKLGIEMLEKARDANPSNPALNMMVQRIKSAQGDFQGVLDLATNVAGIEKYQSQMQSTVGDALRKLAETQGPDAALRKADELLAKQPNDLTLIVLKVDLLLMLERSREAMALLTAAQRAAPDNIDIPRLQAQAWLAQNDPVKALEAIATATQMEIDQGIAEGQGDSNLMELGAQAGLAAEDFKTARFYALKLSRKEPESPRGYLLVAESFKQEGNMRNAIATLEFYARKHPNDFAIKKTLATLYRENGDVDKAIAVLSAGGNQPNDIRATVSQIELALDTNRKSQAQLLAQQAVGNSQNVSHILAIAQVFAQRGENLNAQNLGERALLVSNAANKPDVHGFLGRIYLRRASQEDNTGFYDKARTQFEMVLETHPRDMVAGNNLAWLLATRFNQPEEAVRIIEQVRGNAPLDQLQPAFIDTMIDCYQRAGQAEKARIVAKEAVGLFPREAPLAYRYGMLLSAIEPTLAKQMLTRAVQLGLPAADETEAKRQLANL